MSIGSGVVHKSSSLRLWVSVIVFVVNGLSIMPASAVTVHYEGSGLCPSGNGTATYGGMPGDKPYVPQGYKSANKASDTDWALELRASESSRDALAAFRDVYAPGTKLHYYISAIHTRKSYCEF